MKTIIMAALAGCLFITPAKAQMGGSHWRFRSQEYGGLVQGEQGAYGQGYTINGLYNRTVFVGIGAGLDYYRFRTIPLFLSAEKSSLFGAPGLFLRLDGGLSLPFQSLPAFYPSYYDRFPELRSGSYWNGLIGYKLFVDSRHTRAVLVSGGYSFKRSVVVATEGASYCPIVGPCYYADPSPTRYSYYNHRVSLQVGFQF